MKTLIVVPTFNEAENVESLIGAIAACEPRADILVVDDRSPDGTGDIVKGMMASFPNLKILERSGKEGLGKAYVAGFKRGLAGDYDAFAQMDADFSHRPEDLGRLLAAIKNKDFVIGSRYTVGGRTVNWSPARKIVSRFGSVYSGMILWKNLRDWTGGFNIWRREVLEAIGLDDIHSEGYSFQIELKYKAMQRGYKGVEVPIVFEDRRVGKSKMSSRIVLEAIFKVWKIRFS